MRSFRGGPDTSRPGRSESTDRAGCGVGKQTLIEARYPETGRSTVARHGILERSWAQTSAGCKPTAVMAWPKIMVPPPLPSGATFTSPADCRARLPTRCSAMSSCTPFSSVPYPASTVAPFARVPRRPPKRRPTGWAQRQRAARRGRSPSVRQPASSASRGAPPRTARPPTRITTPRPTLCSRCLLRHQGRYAGVVPAPRRLLAPPARLQHRLRPRERKPPVLHSARRRRPRSVPALR